MAKDARVRRQRVHAATRNAADFHCKFEDLIVTEEITVDMKQMPRQQLGFKDKEGNEAQNCDGQSWKEA